MKKIILITLVALVTSLQAGKSEFLKKLVNDLNLALPITDQASGIVIQTIALNKNTLEVHGNQPNKHVYKDITKAATDNRFISFMEKKIM